MIHPWVIPEHFEEWWGYGLYFLIATIAQVLYAAVLLRWPGQKLMIAGIVGNSAIILLYLVTRTVGIPFFGPGAGEIEEVGLLDVGATMSEVALGALLLRQLSRQDMALAATRPPVGWSDTAPPATHSAFLPADLRMIR